MAEAPNGVYARIPIDELTLTDAYEAVEDASYFDLTMPAVLYHYSLTLEDYGRLTVYQHRLLVDFLEQQGLVDGSP